MAGTDNSIKIGGRTVGSDAPCLVIAEAGVNHNGDMIQAHRLIDEAARAGADAVKFQAFVTEELVTPAAPKAGYQKRTVADGDDTQFRMLKSLELSPENHRDLIAHCREAGILYLCTPYDPPSMRLLDRLDVAAYKIGSSDVANLPLLAQVAATGRPILLSTGMSDMAEVEAAVRAVRKARTTGSALCLLHCVSQYPAPAEQANLRAMESLRRAFGCPVGFSDHAPGIEVAVWAVAAGAAVIEKHFTLDRALPGPDHQASIEPGDLARLVETVRAVEAALGDGTKQVMPCEVETKALMQKSVVARTAIAKGTTITADMLACKRPGGGILPARLGDLPGRIATRDVKADEMLAWADFEGGEQP